MSASQTDFLDAAGILKIWIDSPGHHAQLFEWKNNWKKIGASTHEGFANAWLAE